MSLNCNFYSILYITMPKELQARVEKIFSPVTKKAKDGSDFTTQKVLVVFDEDAEFPSKIVLEQWGTKKIDVARALEEGKEYLFSLNFRANTWTDPNGNETAFGSISAWKAEPFVDPENSWLPF